MLFCIDMITYRFTYAALPLLALVITGGTASAMEGRAWGDIHVRTMDGVTYEFQSSGEFVASRSQAGDFEVQLRLEPAGFPSHVSIASAVAVLVDSTRASVALRRDSPLFVDGQPTSVLDSYLELPGGGRIERSKRGYDIYWSDGSSLTIGVRKRHLNVFLRPAESRRGTLSGLFGNFNGVTGDDVDASIANLGSGASSQLQRGLTDLVGSLLADEGAALDQEESLFEYEPGQTTWSFRRPIPTRDATCKTAGVTDPELLEACIVDVGYTRDESFADTAAAVQERDVSNWDLDLASRVDTNITHSRIAPLVGSTQR